MAIRRPLRFFILLCATLCLFAAAAHAAGPQSAAFTAEIALPEGQAVSVMPQRVRGADWLFLPAAARLDALTLRFEGKEAALFCGDASITVRSGEAFSLFDLSPAPQDRYALTFVCGETAVSFTLMRSEALRSAFLTSADPEKGRAYVDADKDRKVKDGTFTLLRADGSVVWSGPLKNIKSRGNSTWNYPKKPYQIKLSEKADLLETGDKAEKESTWLLLADYIDETLLHNRLTFDLAADFGLDYTAHSASVDLFYDGEYRGVYELCEKIEIAKGRVAIHDLEADIADANPYDIDMDALPRLRGTMDSGLVYQYVGGLCSPADLRGGYLLEMDYPTRAEAEASWLRTANQQYVVVKSPEYLPEDAMQYIGSLYARFENAVYAGGVDPESGADYRELVDLDSLARCFLILELAENNDSFASSAFFYKPSDEEKLYAGPVWDFDTGYGCSALPADCSVAGGTQLGNRLLRIPSFREALQERWSELRPLVSGIVLSADTDAAGARLRSLAGYDAALLASRSMDRVLWSGGDAAPDRVSGLAAHLAHRAEWLDAQLAAWCAGNVPDWSFADVPEDSWFYEPVHYTVRHGLFQGSSAILFQPEERMTRAMAVTVLHRLAGAPDASASSPFGDVQQTTWYAAAVNWAWETGIAKGMSESRFAPGLAVTREQFITMLYRGALHAGCAVGTGAELSAYADGGKVSVWAREAMSWAVGSELVMGSSGKLDPQGFTTRAQAAAIIARFHAAYPSLFGGS